MTERAVRPEHGSDAASAGHAAGAPSRGEAGDLLEAAFDASAAGLAVVSGPDLRFERVNPAYRALTPRPDVEPVGLRFDEVWAGGDPGLLAALRVTLETGEPHRRDDLALSIAGAARRASLHATRLERRGGAALLVATWETTALWAASRLAERAAEDALSRASSLSAILDALPDAFFLYGRRGEILRMNPAAERFAAVRPEERDLPFAARWGRYRAWTAEGHAVTHDETPVARALAGETVRGAHLRIETPAGSAWVLASAAPIRGPDGTVQGAVATLCDESGVHVLEEERDDLVRMISHDLRTPLNAALAHAHLLSRSPDDAARVEERARVIARSCERMNAMIQDLLEATLLEAGQLHMRPSPVDLASFVPEVIERQRGALDVERVSLTAPPAPLCVAADPERLERILVNLVSNALKYSPPQGEVTVEVAPSDGGATIRVTDRGVGIAPEDLPHVFERFFRARGARRPEGLGLGLYITRLLAHAHGGRVDAKSKLGQGSSFSVFLPACGPLPGGAVAP